MVAVDTSGMIQRSKRFLPLLRALVILIIGMAAGLYAWVYQYNPCDVDAVRDASTFLVIQSKRYDDVYASAASGDPGALTYPVTVLQQILVDTQQVAVPVCLRTGKDELLDYMGKVIHAFKLYEAGEKNSTIQDLVYQSNLHYDRFHAELDAVRACAPICFR